ncbi:MCM2/3/5 family-domain-containing protein [Cokeromyces recurvatus]|uniref:MCM2/3/5 family-domain-containing protein n=1 Tax=Cokeromyces recurvatus TaxID=90255 RepID=UPI00221E7831|nr:MCM2/3/5 family-domain-containing protein [Cokeromyces recurvatus]KAI7904580.1 MCM2/3/5 family-domain-containing protein [Cokeromyces recurvatus]
MSSLNPDRKRRRNSDIRQGESAEVGNSSYPDPSSILPSSPAAFFSEANYREEAEEEEVIDTAFGDDNLDNSDDDDIDIFQDAERDYVDNERLDNYEQEGIDDAQYEPLDIAERNAIDRNLNRRDVEIRRREGRVAGAFIYGLDDESNDIQPPVIRRRHIYEAQDVDQDEDGVPEMSLNDLRNVKDSSIAVWITREAVRRGIKREFKDFLQTYVDEHGTSVYGERIRDMGERNKESFEVNYENLAEKKVILAYFLSNSPLEMLKILDEVALEVTLMQFPAYERIHREIHVRITDLPVKNTLRELRQSQLNCLVRVSGVVTRRTGVFPQLKWVKYNCGKCSALLGPFYQDIHNEIKINTCPSCQSKGPFHVNMEQTVYRNYQKLTIQESPGTVPPGRLPRHREVICLWDLIDQAKPGEEIEVIGIYRNNFDASLSTKNGFPVFATIIEANHINKKENMFAAYKLTEDDTKQILEMGKDKSIGKKIIKSIAPSIYGHEDIKRAIALAMFGGVPKNIQGKHIIRGDINILMLGDPGTAKSQFLKYVEKTAHRAVFTTGQGASAVGLTASVHKDPITREWTLEGGALVLADRGVCLIDEFDKMNDADRTSIHEAMEQQSISISKAGIVTTLQARCSVIAAANPIRGRYNSSVPFAQNVELTEPILSRFDVLCVVKDLVDPEQDHILATNVIGSHVLSHPLHNGTDDNFAQPKARDPDIIDQDLLKKYIMYAREKIQPKLQQVDEDKLSRLYSELRRESLANGSIPITVRHLESMIRLAEANAKMHLREYVRSDDVDMAIRVALDSFISAQKYSMMKILRRRFMKFIRNSRDDYELLFATLDDICTEKRKLYQLRYRRLPNEVTITLSEFENRARTLNVQDVKSFFNSEQFKKNRYKLNSSQGVIIKEYN